MAENIAYDPEVEKRNAEREAERKKAIPAAATVNTGWFKPSAPKYQAKPAASAASAASAAPAAPAAWPPHVSWATPALNPVHASKPAPSMLNYDSDSDDAETMIYEMRAMLTEQGRMARLTASHIQGLCSLNEEQRVAFNKLVKSHDDTTQNTGKMRAELTTVRKDMEILFRECRQIQNLLVQLIGILTQNAQVDVPAADGFTDVDLSQ